MDYYEELMNEIEILKLRVEQLTEENRELRRKALDALTEHDQKIGLYEQDVNGIPCHEGTLCFNRECARLGCLLDREQR